MDLTISFNHYAAQHLGLIEPSGVDSYVVRQNILPILHYLNSEWRRSHPDDALLRGAKGHPVGHGHKYQISLTLHPDYAATFMAREFRDIAPKRVRQKIAKCLETNLKTQMIYTFDVKAPALFGVTVTYPNP